MPRRRPSRRSHRRPLSGAVIRPPRILRRSGLARRAPDQGNQERSTGHASHARHVRPSPRHRERTRVELARTPRGPLIRERVRLRNEVRPDTPRESLGALRPKRAGIPRSPEAPAASPRPSDRPSEALSEDGYGPEQKASKPRHASPRLTDRRSPDSPRRTPTAWQSHPADTGIRPSYVPGRLVEDPPDKRRKPASHGEAPQVSPVMVGPARSEL